MEPKKVEVTDVGGAKREIEIHGAKRTAGERKPVKRMTNRDEPTGTPKVIDKRGGQ